MYDAITVDTNIFDEQQLNLEGGLLKQLYQFKDGSPKFVLSEIVVREVGRHLQDRAQKTNTALSSAIARSGGDGLFSPEEVKSLEKTLVIALSPRNAAKARLKTFCENTGCEIIPADQADIKRLIGAYFQPSPPFEGSGKKKSEFPDAIALMTLEDWAKKNHKNILAITKDDGWKQFADKSEWIDVEPDLPAALQKLQQHAEQAETFIRKIVKEAANGQNPELLQALELAVTNGLVNSEPYIEALSAYSYEADHVDVQYVNMEFPTVDENGTPDCYVVRVGKEEITFQVNVEIEATTEVDFSFQIYDSVDKDYVSIGGAHKFISSTFPSSLLVTVIGDFFVEPPVYDIEIYRTHRRTDVRGVRRRGSGLLRRQRLEHRDLPHLLHNAKALEAKLVSERRVLNLQLYGGRSSSWMRAPPA